MIRTIPPGVRHRRRRSGTRRRPGRTRCSTSPPDVFDSPKQLRIIVENQDQLQGFLNECLQRCPQSSPLVTSKTPTTFQTVKLSTKGGMRLQVEIDNLLDFAPRYGEGDRVISREETHTRVKAMLTELGLEVVTNRGYISTLNALQGHYFQKNRRAKGRTST